VNAFGDIEAAAYKVDLVGNRGDLHAKDGTLKHMREIGEGGE
jgi:hypothetical protein